MAQLDVHQTMTDPLTQLAIKYRSDRHPGSKHSYTPYYYGLFNTRRNTLKKMLEIGVGEHSGLRMWRDFFPQATIFGAENLDKRIYNEERIQVFFCDQSSQKDLENLISAIGPDLDFVVDDGSHKPEDQIFTCQTLMPLLNKNVVYVIEDVADLSLVNKLTDYRLEIPKLVPKKTRYDDRLVVVRHD